MYFYDSQRKILIDFVTLQRKEQVNKVVGYGSPSVESLLLGEGKRGGRGRGQNKEKRGEKGEKEKKRETMRRERRKPTRVLGVGSLF